MARVLHVPPIRRFDENRDRRDAILISFPGE